RLAFTPAPALFVRRRTLAGSSHVEAHVHLVRILHVLLAMSEVAVLLRIPTIAFLPVRTHLDLVVLLGLLPLMLRSRGDLDDLARSEVGLRFSQRDPR